MLDRAPEICSRVRSVDIPDVEVRVNISHVEEDVAVYRDVPPTN